MIELNFFDADHQLADHFESEGLAALFAAHSFSITGLPPAGETPTAQWNDDAVIASLETLQEDLLPKAATPQQQGGGSVTKAESDLSDLDRQAIHLGGSRQFTLHDTAMVEIFSPLVAAQVPAAPAGYSDLVALIALMKSARNRALALQVVSL